VLHHALGGLEVGDAVTVDAGFAAGGLDDLHHVLGRRRVLAFAGD
jgi:hypothetical protein